MALDQNSGVPLYQQLERELEKAIYNGVYLPGDKLPTEGELTEMYGVSTITVRKAVERLADKGMVTKKQGKGTFVQRIRYDRNIKKIQSFSEMCRQMGVRPGGKMLKSSLVDSDEVVAKELEVNVGEKVIFIKRLRYADDNPVQIERSYYPLQFAEMLNQRFDDNSLFVYLHNEYRINVAGSKKRITLGRASAEDAQLLNLKEGDSVIVTLSTAYDDKDRPIYVCEHITNGDRFAFYVYETAVST